MSIVPVKLGKANTTIRKADQSLSLHLPPAPFAVQPQHRWRARIRLPTAMTSTPVIPPTTSKCIAVGATLSAKRIRTHLRYWVRP